MKNRDVFTDKKGNTILVAPDWYIKFNLSKEDFAKAIIHPMFIIEEKQNVIYFLRNLGWDINLLIHAELEEENYVVINCSINPTKEDIKTLLQKGTLLAF